MEDLLNTKIRCLSTPELHTEVKKSILNYGIPDLTSLNLTSESGLSVFCRDVETIIKHFEPRFEQVKVSPLKAQEKGLNKTIRFRIDALMISDPAPEVVIFDSELESASRNVSLTEANHV